jgi:hypothetical protein
MSSISNFDGSRLVSSEMLVARTERSAMVRQQPRPQTDTAEATNRQQNPGATDSVETSADVTKKAKEAAVNPAAAEQPAEAPKVTLPPPESVFLVELAIYENRGQQQTVETEKSSTPRLDIRI